MISSSGSGPVGSISLSSTWSSSLNLGAAAVALPFAIIGRLVCDDSAVIVGFVSELECDISQMAEMNSQICYHSCQLVRCLLIYFSPEKIYRVEAN